MKKNVLWMLIVFSLVPLLAQEYVEVNFEKNPFATNPSQWKTGGTKNWQWNSGILISGAIENSSETWMEFEANVGDGKFSFGYSISSEKSCDLLIFSIDNQDMFVTSGENQDRLEFSIAITKGQHKFRWLYKKDLTKSEGDDKVHILWIKYPIIASTHSTSFTPTNSTTVSNIRFGLLQYQDNESLFSWGNDDHIVNTFETIFVNGIFEDTQEDITIEPALPAHIFLVNGLSFSLNTKEKKASFSFSFIVGPQYNQAKVFFPIHVKKNTKILKTYNFEAPFDKVDISRRYLQQEKILSSKKFNYASQEELDSFLDKFPDSEFAPVVFRFRLEYCRNFRDEILKKLPAEQEAREKELIKAINVYNEFIKKYPGKLLTRIAIHECFELYTMVGRISFYNNFIQRYPYMEHSLVAKEHIKMLLYSLVCTENTVDAYEKFIQIYPEESFYRTRCIALAQQKAIEEEQNQIDQILKKALAKNTVPSIQPLIEENTRNKRANAILSEIYKIIEEYNKMQVSEKVQKYLTDNRIERITQIIRTVYPDTSAMSAILLIQRLQDIIQLTQETQKMMQKLHDETLHTMGNYFQTLNNDLKKNFQSVEDRLTQINQNINSLHEHLNAVHLDIQKRFDNVDQKLEKINADVQNINQKLDIIDNRLQDIDKKVQEGFAQVNKKLDTGMEKIGTYFQTLHGDLENINQGMLKLDNGLAQLNTQNKEFLRQNAQIYTQLEKMNSLYAGYQKYDSSSDLKCSIGNTVGNLLELGVSSIPVAGPILSKVAAPVLGWLGNKVTDGASALWNKIF
ncbi:MAG: hypothetical protein HUU50_04220 [Candidatus Brocadiae bacterium]|nr:hypothetical protein [Candidatus Brocadiia bacterium]